jgi:hypothetical protein
LATRTNWKLAAGLIIELRIHISYSDEESGRCWASGACATFRNSFLSTFLYIRISTRSATSTAENFKLNRAAALFKWLQLGMAFFLQRLVGVRLKAPKRSFHNL